jgi:hypothetical protein
MLSNDRSIVNYQRRYSSLAQMMLSTPLTFAIPKEVAQDAAPIRTLSRFFTRHVVGDLAGV